MQNAARATPKAARTMLIWSPRTPRRIYYIAVRRHDSGWITTGPADRMDESRIIVAMPAATITAATTVATTAQNTADRFFGCSLILGSYPRWRGGREGRLPSSTTTGGQKPINLVELPSVLISFSQFLGKTLSRRWRTAYNVCLGSRPTIAIRRDRWRKSFLLLWTSAPFSGIQSDTYNADCGDVR